MEDWTPEIQISQTSTTSPITDESNNTNLDLLIMSQKRNYNTNELTIKLREKSAQDNSSKDFLSCFIQKKFIPKGLELI